MFNIGRDTLSDPTTPNRKKQLMRAGAAVIMGAGALAACTQNSDKPVQYGQYQVESGDTAFGIARHFSGNADSSKLESKIRDEVREEERTAHETEDGLPRPGDVLNIPENLVHAHQGDLTTEQPTDQPPVQVPVVPQVPVDAPAN